MRFLPLLTFTLTALAYSAYSYCVYNRHSDVTQLDVRQYKFSTEHVNPFRKVVYPPSGRECCSYTDPNCNPNIEDPKTVVKLYVARVFEQVKKTHFSVTLPADGSVTVDGDREHHTVAVKKVDGTNYTDLVIEYGAKWDPVRIQR
ncbi:hypothetical protein BJV82DRAFT_581043 [Fennellomyces sp. T-0311]|nr:hypothetical protein BJV82DRAFT_581043 [Fennellomyces sp. T-0311]